MSSPRLRRLRLDYEQLDTRFRDWPAIRISNVAGDPPEKYQVTYRARGLYSTPAGQILERAEHVVEINLSLGYPRRAPQCKMLTPIFHPNFDDVSVCIGDFWAASEGLDDLIVRIGRMITYQEYNTKSPLNGLAAKWAAQNAQLLPVDGTEMAPPSESARESDSEKVVVRFDEDFSAPDLAPEATFSEAVADEIAPTIPDGVPRLDFGLIAVALRPNRTTVGRAPDNDVQLSHGTISGHHGEVVEADGGFIVRDLGSTNGVTLNGSAVTEAKIVDGDEVCFGAVQSTFFT